MTETVTIFMPLANEAVDCWRPVQARPVGAGLYEVLGPVPEQEEWQFPPGSLVRCKRMNFEDGESGLVAISAK